jgi:hypothetical protein
MWSLLGIISTQLAPPFAMAMLWKVGTELREVHFQSSGKQTIMGLDGAIICRFNKRTSGVACNGLSLITYKFLNSLVI